MGPCEHLVLWAFWPRIGARGRADRRCRLPASSSAGSRLFQLAVRIGLSADATQRALDDYELRAKLLAPGPPGLAGVDRTGGRPGGTGPGRLGAVRIDLDRYAPARGLAPYCGALLVLTSAKEPH
jgi:hypothetical protein